MKKFVFLLLVFVSFEGASQDSPEVSQNVLSVNFFVPGLEYEFRVSPESTLDLGIGSGFGLAGGYLAGDTDFGFFPFATAQYRYFYNLEKRLRKNKSVDINSANYLALYSNITSGKPIIGDLQMEEGYQIAVGPVWGLQRYFQTGFKLDLRLGLGYFFEERGDSFVSPIIGISLGWLLVNNY